MCTVTFIPTPDGFYLTSNRDESRRRGAALPPAVYSAGMEKVIYPKDSDAGGSWIALKENATAAVLLNGAFRKHLRWSPYRMSRGMILLEIIRSTDPLPCFQEIDLAMIEPFTLIVFADGRLWDCRWDGTAKHIRSLDIAKPHIWSSATLFDDLAAKERRQKFDEWIKGVVQPAPDDILSFHRSARIGDNRNSLVVNGNNELDTVSVTSIVTTREKTRMSYNDLKTGINTVAGFEQKADIGRVNKVARGKWAHFIWVLKKFRIRLMHWEFWPTHVVYAPVYLYWAWLSLRARSFFFFNAANPRIENGGFTHERKSAIYRQLPGRYYPRTHLCPAGTEWETLKRQLANRALVFPLIAKPDIGERGVQVRLVNTENDLEAYCRRSRVDFLVQEYVPYEMEAGIFFVRIPGEATGRITGIVGKEFLSVTGDGCSTIRMLLREDFRSLLQLETLSGRYGEFLETVLSKGEIKILVPYGNHSRGAKFIDWSDKITDRLTAVINRICKRIPDFYYGRLDVKFASWEDLLAEKNFSLIEVNGAGSEPTHIYDPVHSLLFAWKEIIRHCHLLYHISLANSKRKNIPLMSTRDGLRMLAAHRRYLKMMEQL